MRRWASAAIWGAEAERLVPHEGQDGWYGEDKGAGGARVMVVVETVI